MSGEKTDLSGIKFRHEELEEEIAALKEVLKELIPIAERMQATCEYGGYKSYDNEWDAADAIEYKAVIEHAKKLLNKQPQSESDKTE